MLPLEKMSGNSTVTEGSSDWNSAPMWRLPEWGEPVIVLSILIASMIINRRRNFSVFGGRGRKEVYDSVLDDPDNDAARSSDGLLSDDSASEGSQDGIDTARNPPKKRNCCGLIIRTPNSSRFSSHLHSRIMQKFPFLMEMFYWVITYLLYRFARISSQQIFSESGIWDVALDNGLRILDFEEFSWLNFLFPIREHDVQQWFLKNHHTALTFLNRFYALIHIPGTVGFIAWYYYVAPSFSTFATVRRTLTLTNYMAFTVFTVYPCMPPRMLPEEYGFLDTVRRDSAQSVWMSGKYVNLLAAMPSMHFGYSFVIGCTMLYHSGIFRRTLKKGEVRKSVFWKTWYLLFAFTYPLTVLLAIVATANHYFLDAVVAILVSLVAFACNRIFLVFLPAEDVLLWALRIEKPTPSTGEMCHKRAGML